MPSLEPSDQLPMNLFNFKRSNPVPSNSLQTIDAHTLKQWLDQNTALVVDVREANEFAGGRIPGATLVSLSAFDPDKIPQPKHQKVVLYCRSGQRSTMAGQRLLNAGFSEVIHLGGGIGAWARAGYPIQTR